MGQDETRTSENREPQTFGVALSGGGHRATAYALGVLLYLVDSGLNQKVQTITSVSGGSILNAFIALLRSADSAEKRSFKSFAAGEFDEHAAKLASLLSGSRSIWLASVTVALCGTGLALFSVLFFSINATTALLSLAMLLLVVSSVGPKSGGSLWGWWGTWVYCSAITWLAVAGVVATRTMSHFSAEILLPVILCGWAFQQRHWVAERAYEHTVCSPLMRNRKWPVTRARLEDMNTEVRHVFCATEMHSGQHAYFSHDFVYARGFGLGRPAALPVASAVQVSANFPGGFPIRPLRASRFDFSLTDRYEDVIQQGIRSGRDILMPDEDEAWANANKQFVRPRPLPEWLMLSDGGVFDNLAVDWYLENQARLARFRMYLNWGYDGDKPVQRDEGILSPLKDSPESLIVVNAGVTSHWRHGSSAMVFFPFIGEVIGLSQISGTMYNNYTKERIRALQQHLVIELSFAERLVRTTLLPLGEHVTARLMQAGYSQAMYAAMRRFGRHLPHFEVKLEDFNLLAQGKARKKVPKLWSVGD